MVQNACPSAPCPAYVIAPPLAENESERLADLQAYDILDTPAEAVFDEIAELAAAICGTAYAAITFIDRDRQWLFAKHRLDGEFTTRDESICGHAIAAQGFFEVPDISRDERFHDNPALAQFRFYGGSPLVADSGHALGMLCVLDPEPHHLDERQKQSLLDVYASFLALNEADKASAETPVDPAEPVEDDTATAQS